MVEYQPEQVKITLNLWQANLLRAILSQVRSDNRTSDFIHNIYIKLSELEDEELTDIFYIGEIKYQVQITGDAIELCEL